MSRGALIAALCAFAQLALGASDEAAHAPDARSRQAPENSPESSQFTLHIVLTSRWASRERRELQRRALTACAPLAPLADVTYGFYMADVPDGHAVDHEELRRNDMVIVGGPDTDPVVERDETYILDRPSARAYRLALACAVLARSAHLPDYTLFLDDDAFINIPRLVAFLAERYPTRPEPRASGGAIMMTMIDHNRAVYELDPREFAEDERMFVKICGDTWSQYPVSLYGCIHAGNECLIRSGCLVGDECEIRNDYEWIKECMLRNFEHSAKLGAYFETVYSPPWPLGMGFYMGSDLVSYIGRNYQVLKLRGAADLSIGYWLAPIEDIDHVDHKSPGRFHDFPAQNSMFARNCTSDSILVHRVTGTRWQYFEPETCSFDCVWDDQTWEEFRTSVAPKSS